MSRVQYLENFPVIYEEIKQSVNNKINKIQSKNVNPNFIDRYCDMLANDYCTIGIGEICLNNNIIAAKKNFYLAGKLQEMLLQKYDNKEMKISPSFVTMNKFNRLLLAIISDSIELTTSLSGLMGGRIKEEKDYDHPFNYNVGYTLKYIIQNENEKAINYIDDLKKLKDQKEVFPYKSYIIVLNSILEGDNRNLNTGLNLLIEDHKKNDIFKDTADELISIPAIGLSKLAELKGLKVNINDDLLPNVLKRDIIDYPNLDLIK